MALPIVEQIAVKLRTRLGLISTGNGYETTAAGVYRPTRIATFHPKDYNIVVTQGDQVPNDAHSHMGNPPVQAFDMPFIVAGTLRPSEASTTPADTFKNTFWADCVKAITAATDWHNWDQLAIDTKISDAVNYVADDGSDTGFKLSVIVTYRVSENDPYTVRA